MLEQELLCDNVVLMVFRHFCQILNHLLTPSTKYQAQKLLKHKEVVLKLKPYAAQYIDSAAKLHDTELQRNRTMIAEQINKKLKFF